MVLDPTVVAAIVAVFGAVVAYLLGARQASLERKRKACAEALADALNWLELPYRIRRRVNDDPETLSALAERISHVRERQEFHEKWLRVEIPKAHPHFRRLVEDVRRSAGAAITDAWKASPARVASDMNIGRLDINRELVDQAVESFSSEVTKQLAWWRVLS